MASWQRWRIITWAGLLLFNACGDDILNPGDVSGTLVGTYILENRQFVALDSARTVVATLMPPELQASLRLTEEGRYAQVDTLNTPEISGIFTETGRWSTQNNQFFSESDDELRISTQIFLLSGPAIGDTLTLILPDQQGNNVPSGFFDVIDLWRKIR